MDGKGAESCAVHGGGYGWRLVGVAWVWLQLATPGHNVKECTQRLGKLQWRLSLGWGADCLLMPKWGRQMRLPGCVMVKGKGQCDEASTPMSRGTVCVRPTGGAISATFGTVEFGGSFFWWWVNRFVL